MWKKEELLREEFLGDPETKHIIVPGFFMYRCSMNMRGGSKMYNWQLYWVSELSPSVPLASGETWVSYFVPLGLHSITE